MAIVSSLVMLISDLDKSIAFYREVFACVVTVREEGAALLLTPHGFQLYLHERDGSTKYHPIGDTGVQYVAWAAESEQELHQFAERLRELDPSVRVNAAGEVSFVDGRDPDGIRVIIAYPGPEKLPRALIDPRFR
jgi:catechol 2,3-dioxygenase-like lactoylglutathione lyase family enzyme